MKRLLQFVLICAIAQACAAQSIVVGRSGCLQDAGGNVTCSPVGGKTVFVDGAALNKKLQLDLSGLTVTRTLTVPNADSTLVVPFTCTNQFATGASSSGAFTCGTVAYSALSGTPTLAGTLASALHKWLKSYDASTGTFTQTQPDYADLTGTPTLPANTASVLHQFITAYNSGTGAFSQAQPAFGDVSGSASCSQLPALTGDVTTSAGACATTLGTVAIAKGGTGQTSAAAAFNALLTSQTGNSGKFLTTDGSNPSWGAPSGAGTVTTFSAGNLSPLFTTSVATATSTPALTFTISNAPAHSYLGNNTGATTAPAYVSIALGDIPGSGALTINTTSPLGGGGSVSLGGSLTLTCSTCLTSAPVTSVFTRTGAVTASSGDYTAAQVTNAWDVTAANTLTNVAAPSTPAAGKTAVYVDSTNKVLSSKNDAGTVSNTVVASSAGANQFATGVSAPGVVSYAQPSFTNLSGSESCAQTPALTGDVTTSAGSCATAIGSGKVTRADLAALAKNWSFCGTASTATVTVGPVNAGTCCNGGTCQQFMVKYLITGYSGGSPVGRLQMGPGTPSTTALTNSISISEGVTAPTTSTTSPIPGLPLAVTVTALGRSGTCWIDGLSGSFKVIDCIGNEGTPSLTVPPILFRGASFFSDLSTNLALQQFQLTVYDALTGATVSTRTFTSGTYITVWGRNND